MSDRHASHRPSSVLAHAPACASAGIEVVFGGPEIGPRHETTHDNIEIAIPCAGACVDIRYHTDGARAGHAQVSGHHVSVIPAGQPHAVDWRQPAELVVVFVAPHVLDDLAETWGRHRWLLPEQYMAIDAFVRHIGISLRADLAAGHPLSALYLDALAQVLAAHLLRTYCVGGHDRPAEDGLPQYVLRRVVDYIQANLANDVPLSGMAAVAGASPSHFSRRFKLAMGVGPHRYVTLCRIERAKEYLRHSEQGILEIALNVGFASQSYMTAVFHRTTGVTPAEFRQNQCAHSPGFPRRDPAPDSGQGEFIAMLS
ncbi:helix-turn-helix transcriptional regulator [Cupriavidus sp. RAF12]|uniref:helix-turn-helix transcriptional regulator n=1 Tax=Cupriavidus sp. RAF12 TaxID=3233050 RepID=UPI003F914654